MHFFSLLMKNLSSTSHQNLKIYIYWTSKHKRMKECVKIWLFISCDKLECSFVTFCGGVSRALDFGVTNLKLLYIAIQFVSIECDKAIVLLQSCLFGSTHGG
jgi:hypothetical protein